MPGVPGDIKSTARSVRKGRAESPSTGGASLASGPARPSAHTEARTRRLRPNAGSRRGCGQHRTFQEPREAKEPGPGKSERKSMDRQTSAPGSNPASPSHGELDYGESGARAAQLRLEIRVAPDRLHTHHPDTEPAWAAATATASEVKKKTEARKAKGSGRPRPGQGAGDSLVSSGALSAESRQAASGRGGGDGRGRGEAAGGR